MSILRSYKKTRFFLWINIIGLSIGLAVSILLALFVVNELSYDRHWANGGRIVQLNSVVPDNDGEEHLPINLRRAFTEVPGNVPGIEAATQILYYDGIYVKHGSEWFTDVKAALIDPSFFDIFETLFIEGSAATAITDPNSVILTRSMAEKIFGGVKESLGGGVIINEEEFLVTAVVEEYPGNSSFHFDLMANVESQSDYYGLEYFTFYLIDRNASVPEVRKAIEREYDSILIPFVAGWTKGKAYAETEMFTDTYLRGKADWSMGQRNTMQFVWLLSVLALLILLLAVTNFINLFMAQGETRMKEIGVRKTNGAARKDIIMLLFREISVVVFIAFVLGFVIAVLAVPFFSRLVGFSVDMSQLASPAFIVSAIGLFLVTVILSGLYPAFYLSRFNTLEILNKRIKFSKRRISSVVLVFQSVVTIVLISFIMTIGRQTAYLKNIDPGYNPSHVLDMRMAPEIAGNFDAFRQEMLAIPGVEAVSGSGHTIGSGPSGYSISLYETPEDIHSVNLYRIMTGLPELLEFRLLDGEFFRDDKGYEKNPVMVNRATLKMLGLEMPVAGKEVNFDNGAVIIGVVEDFCYGEPADPVNPLVLSCIPMGWNMYIRFGEHIGRIQAQNTVKDVVAKFSPDFILDPTWGEDMIAQKFETFEKQSKVITLGIVLSFFIAVMGLVATHLYTTVRRTKEIGIRRVNGASSRDIFTLLSGDILKWIAVAGIIAIPVAYYIGSGWMADFTNRISISIWVFILPILFQCIIALLVTSGISFRVARRNPVEALKTE